jgi:hypothetical protein
MEFFSYVRFQSVHCWCIERLLVFVIDLYPATLLKLFMGSLSFSVEFFGSLRYRILLQREGKANTESVKSCYISPLSLLELNYSYFAQSQFHTVVHALFISTQ